MEKSTYTNIPAKRRELLKFNSLKDNSGVIIVEGAVIIPLFLMFMLTFLFVSNVFIAQSKLQTATAQTASEISEYGYLYFLPVAKNGSDIINSAITAYNKFSHFPAHYDDKDIEDYIGDARGKITSIPALESVYDAIAFSPPAIIATTIVAKQKYTDDNEQKVDATIAKVLLKKHLVESGKTDDVNNSLKALGIVDGLDGIDFGGTNIYKNEQIPITFSHDWNLTVNAFSITHNYVPHENKKTITNHSFSGNDPSYIGLSQELIKNYDAWNSSSMPSNMTSGDMKWSAWSTLKSACRFYQSKGHNMTFTTNYDGTYDGITGKSHYTETCSDAGSDIPQRTTRNWSRKMITLKLSYELQPLSWFGKWKFPVTHQIVTETWVPPSRRIEEDKSTSSTYNPKNPSGPSENSPTPTNPPNRELVNCISPYQSGQYRPASCGGL